MLLPLPTSFKCISQFCVKTLCNLLRAFSVMSLQSQFSHSITVWSTHGQDRTISHHCSILPSIFSCFFSSRFAQAAKQAIEAGFIFNPNSLRLPFNAWVSVGQALWNVHRTNIVEANYALQVLGLASLSCMHAPLHLIHQCPAVFFFWKMVVKSLLNNVKW